MIIGVLYYFGLDFELKLQETYFKVIWVKRWARKVCWGMVLRGSWDGSAEVTLSGCLSRKSRGRDCCVLRVSYVYFEEFYILLRFG